MAIHLSDRAVIALTGPEAGSFLQGLVTNDVARLKPGVALYAALLSPQGKILFDFLMAEGDGAVLLDCAAESAPALLKRLSMYRLRAKVEIALREQLGVYAGLEGESAMRGVSFADPRLPELGSRTIGPRAEMPAKTDGVGAYHARRLDLGVPEGADFGTEKIFALDGGLEELHAVSFTKGCYVGQELTARMKHRGTARKRLLPIIAPDGALPAPGCSVTAGGQEIGEIASAYGARGFALVRLDRLAAAGDSPLASADTQVAIAKPAWLFA